MRRLLAFLVLFGLLLSGCGGGGSSSGPAPTPTVLTGTAAAGAPIIGQVTVKDSSTPIQSKSALIEANGAYSVDVTGMTAPFVLRAEGMVGGRTYKLHSYAEAADVGGTVNITPFTDLIVANAAGQLAETLFDNGDFSTLSDTEIAAQQTALKDKLQNVLTSLGVDTAVDLLHTAFSADHSALDAALDMVRVSVNPETIEATITNVIDNTTIVDNLQSTTDNTAVLDVVSDLGTVQSSQQAIYGLLNNFAAQFANGLPGSSQLSPFLAADFLQNDEGAAQFITDLTTDPGMIGVSFPNLVIDALDETAGTATVTFHPVFGGIAQATPETWQLAKNGAAWEIRGNQEIVDRWTDFICDYNTNADGSSTRTCGINLGADDFDASNNPGGVLVDSARVTLLRGGTPVPGAVVYMGVPTGGAAGELRIYDTDYSDDFMAFGTGALQIDPSLFQVGDTVRFELFTSPLDLTDPAAPAVSGSAVATYTTPVTTLPIADGNGASYPTATSTTLTAFNALTTAGGDLTVSWDTLPAGQTIDELALIVCDGVANCADIWKSRPANGITLSLDTSGLDAQVASYVTELRIYSRDVQGRSFLRTYHSTTATGDSSVPTTGFTTQMLDAQSRVYITYAGNPDGTLTTGTTQESFAFSGSGGSYQVVGSQEYFDAGNVSQGVVTMSGSAVLNQDGTLTLNLTGNPTITFTLDSANTDSLAVTGTNGTDTWSDTWFLAQPTGWLSSSAATAFTSQMLDAGPTIYITYGGNPDGTLTTGTTQETFAFSGTGGSYSVTGTQEYFDAGNVSQGAATLTGTAVLNQDGTLTVNLTGNPAMTFTLNSTSVDSLVVTGANGVDTWTDTWYLVQPAGWLATP